MPASTRLPWWLFPIWERPWTRRWPGCPRPNRSTFSPAIRRPASCARSCSDAAGCNTSGRIEPVESMTLRICHLYPTLMNIAGDRGNIFALQRRCQWRGIRPEVTEVGVGETPDFTAFDLILFHGGQDVEMDVAARDLATKAASLREAVESDVVVLAVCAGYQLLGRYYQPSKGARLEGVGALDCYTEAGNTRYMNHVA